MPIGEFLVVKAHQMQDGGMKIVHMNTIAGNADSVFIGFTVNRSLFDTGP